MRASGYPSKSMYTILIGVGLNILLDPLFIFGFGMEIRGAAVATVISMFVSSLFVLSHFFNPKHPVHFRRDCWVPKKDHPQYRVDRHGSFPDESGGEYRQCHHEQSAGPRGRRSGDRRFRNHQQLRHSDRYDRHGTLSGHAADRRIQLRSPEAQAYERRAQADDPDRYADHGGRLRGLRADAAAPRPALSRPIPD